MSRHGLDMSAQFGERAFFRPMLYPVTLYGDHKRDRSDMKTTAYPLIWLSAGLLNCLQFSCPIYLTPAHIYLSICSAYCFVTYCFLLTLMIFTRIQVHSLPTAASAFVAVQQQERDVFKFVIFDQECLISVVGLKDAAV